MSTYTTELRYICESSAGLKDSAGASRVEEIIAKAIPSIFNFDFPIFDENYRTVLETKILRHFYTREIGLETVGLWQLKLNTKLNEIMPYYNQLYKSELLEFDPIYTYHMTKEHGGERHDIGKVDNNTTSNGNNGSTDAYSDTPQGTLGNLADNTYLTSASKHNGTDYNHLEGHIDNTLDTTEGYLETVKGYSGTSGSELLLKYRKTFLNIDMMVIGDLEELFMQLW